MRAGLDLLTFLADPRRLAAQRRPRSGEVPSCSVSGSIVVGTRRVVRAATVDVVARHVQRRGELNLRSLVVDEERAVVCCFHPRLPYTKTLSLQTSHLGTSLVGVPLIPTFTRYSALRSRLRRFPRPPRDVPNALLRALHTVELSSASHPRSECVSCNTVVCGLTAYCYKPTTCILYCVFPNSICALPLARTLARLGILVLAPQETPTSPLKT